MGGAPFPPPRRKSRAGLIVLAILLPIGLVILACGGIFGYVAYDEYQKEERIRALTTVVNTLGQPTAYSSYGSGATENDLNARYVMYCSGSTCQTWNPVKEALNWLRRGNFSVGSEQDVATCFRNACVLTTSQSTNAGTVTLTAQLTVKQNGYEFEILLHGTLPTD